MTRLCAPTKGRSSLTWRSTTTRLTPIRQQYDWRSISQTHAVGQRFADDDICEPFTWEDYVDYHQSTDCPSHLRFTLALSTIAFFCVF